MKVRHCFHSFHEVMGSDVMFLVLWMLSFKPTFSFFSFIFIKRLFSISSLSAIRVVSFAYLRLLIFLPAILIPVCAFHLIPVCAFNSAYKLNKQDDNIQPWHTPFPIRNKSVVNLCSNTCIASVYSVSLFFHFKILFIFLNSFIKVSLTFINCIYLYNSMFWYTYTLWKGHHSQTN